MRSAVALMLGVLLPLLGFAGVGQAQSSIEVQGTLQTVDCNAQTITLGTSSGTNTITVAPYTAILINSSAVPLCALQQYIGVPVTVWLVASGSDFVATRVDVSAVAYTPPPPSVPTYAPSPLPIVGVVLGTIVVAGLLYLLVHGPDGGYYRYPYYGAYYHYYYRPYYYPYYGYFPALCPIIVVPTPIVGVVLGTIVVGTLAYLVSRDSAGNFYRYPYYGPYHQYYYRTAYQPYRGPYMNAVLDAPVRQGDPRWDGPSHAGTQNVPPAFHGASDPQRTSHPAPSNYTLRAQPANQPAPAYRGPVSQPAPTYRGPVSQPAPTYRGPVSQPAPTYRGPVSQPAPAYRNLGQQPRTDYRNYNTRSSGGQNYRGRGRSCGNQSQNQPCH